MTFYSIKETEFKSGIIFLQLVPRVDVKELLDLLSTQDRFDTVRLRILNMKREWVETILHSSIHFANLKRKNVSITNLTTHPPC